MALKAIIIGGGIGGLTCARAFLDAGMQVELYEKRDLDSMLSGPGGIFIQRNAMRVYELLWQGKIQKQLYQQGAKILSGGFFSKQAKPLYINAPEFVKLEDLGICILRPELQRILYNALPEGTVRNKAAFTDFSETSDGIRVSFADGREAWGDVLIGADGLYSQVRARLNGNEKIAAPVYSGMCCWRGWFSQNNLPLDQRYSWGEFWGRGNRFGYFDVGSGRFAFYGFSNTPAGGNDRTMGGAKKAMQAIFSSYAQPIPAIIETLSEEGIYRDDIFDREPLGMQWGRGRVTLIGDAAHPVQPNLGQGGCMAIEDAFELVKLLRIRAEKGGDIPALLRQFEASRSKRVAQVFTVSRQVGGLGQTDSAFGCFLRDSIYWLTPTWLGDLQFKWLFDYQPQWGLEDGEKS
ncbi:FAD-dependent monooxygenase [Planktothrix sp. FACHB-1355]|uniref:FAD-dependent monooxygenase n=1 Tax=Aerosakkonema funiforme FACHB-1375 TaxID=2949571 RepID=A0A926VC19_9CYAN|nr:MULTISPECIES: FAD-dependent monooxygenase [Oscillatoriales]MBD2180780.1 FAD-dependent monooxygenase [Aerosakkonema funiforme FACHB-1375]MBD3560581.1 FAD-dependent monooxygenase [Planktothrix sp. FACHB-1355]